MKWTAEAEEALKRVPVFVRRRVRARIEKEAGAEGKAAVTLKEVETSRRRFVSGMQSEVRGYQVDTCFGPSGCPNRARSAEVLLARIERLLKTADLLAFLKKSVQGDLKFHHEFRVTLAECPNACSQPQIKDVGIIGAAQPEITAVACTQCGACTETCREAALESATDGSPPDIDLQRCLSCGQCIPVCPTGTLAAGCRGFRVLLGGKLGRHPRLARELPGIYTEEQVLQIIKECLDLFKQRSTGGRRFSDLFTDTDFKEFCRRFPASNA
jgi:dissimilatory sulfite reductase (desulfoviridin) alpha/beta subunit